LFNDHKDTDFSLTNDAKSINLLAHHLPGWSWDYSSQLTSSGQTIFTADAHRDGKRLIVHADEKLSAFLELQKQTGQLVIAARNAQDWTEA